MRPAARSSAALAAALLVLSACSGGGGAASSSPSRAQFQQRALAICHTYQRKIGLLQGSTDLAELAAQGRKAVALQRAELRELRALTPPDADRDRIERMLDALDTAATTADGLVTAADAGDATATATAAARLRLQLAAANKLAKPYGLDVCTT